MSQQQSQQQAPDPRMDYLNAANADYFGPGQELTGQLGGLDNPKYAFTNTMKASDALGDRAIAAGKAGWQTYLDTEKLGLSQDKNAREAEAQGYKYSSPDADYLVAHMKGWTPEMIQHALTAGDAGMVDTLMQSIGAVDKDGAPDYNPVNIQRLAHLEQYHDNKQAELATQDAVQSKQTRWASLDPEQRARETFLRLQSPGENVVVSTQGQTLRGPDAEARAAKAMQPRAPTDWGRKANPAPGPKRSLGRDVGNFAGDIQKQKGMVGTAYKWSPPGLMNQGVNTVIDKGPKAARAAWHYAFG